MTEFKTKSGRFAALRLRRDALRARLLPRAGRRLLSAYEARLSGGLPPRGGPPIVFAACDTGYYFRFGIAFILSIEAAGRPQAVHLHLYEPSPAVLDHIATLRGTLRTVSLTFTSEDAAARNPAVERIVHYTAARFMVLSLLAKRCDAPLLLLDIDGLVVGDLAPVFAGVKTGDIALHRRPAETELPKKVLAAGFALNRTRRARRTIDRIARMVAMGLKAAPSSHIDQSILHLAYRSSVLFSEGRTRWVQLPDAVVDHQLSPDGIVWTAKGQRKHADAFRARLEALRAAYPSAFESFAMAEVAEVPLVAAAPSGRRGGFGRWVVRAAASVLLLGSAVAFGATFDDSLERMTLFGYGPFDLDGDGLVGPEEIECAPLADSPVGWSPAALPGPG